LDAYMPKPRRSEPARPAKKKPAPTPVKAKGPAKSVKPAKPAKARPVKAVPSSAKKGARPAKPQAKLPHKAASTPVAKPGKKVVAPSRPAVPAGPSTHELAVAKFERGFKALQQRQYVQAAELLASVVSDFPDEKEMQERARVYLSICERQVDHAAHPPRSFEERVNAATVAINRGAFEEALALLRKLEADHGSSDHVQYMLSVVHTMNGDFANALRHLQQAVALNHENRYLASQDADLEALRADAGFAAAIEIHAAKAKPAATAKKR
jgi:hypothetical protein